MNILVTKSETVELKDMHIFKIKLTARKCTNF